MTVLQLLQDIRGGLIEVRWDARHHNLNGVVVCRADLVTAMGRVRAERLTQKGYSLSEIGKALFPQRPMTFRSVRCWIRTGLLTAQRKGRHWLITPEEVQRFRNEYCLSAEACRILGISPSTLVHWRAAGKLEPIYGRGAKIPGNFSLFRRSDILQLRSLWKGETQEGETRPDP